ncbi:hypothetical protein AUP68_16937 [Ilyonectria robusta]
MEHNVSDAGTKLMLTVLFRHTLPVSTESLIGIQPSIAMTNTRFQEWYSSYGTLFQNISSNVCNETLQGYLAASNGDTCDLHIDCMLENTRESVKSAIASAAIFLSLVPTVMSMLGPSLVHLAILSTRRPILSFLLSVGSSEFYLDGLFRIESTEELLSTTKGERLFPRIRGPRAVLISAGEYVLACLAVATGAAKVWCSAYGQFQGGQKRRCSRGAAVAGPPVNSESGSPEF